MRRDVVDTSFMPGGTPSELRLVRAGELFLTQKVGFADTPSTEEIPMNIDDLRAEVLRIAVRAAETACGVQTCNPLGPTEAAVAVVDAYAAAVAKINEVDERRLLQN